MRGRSLSTRLVVALVSVVVIAWLVAVGIAAVVVQGELGEALDGAMQETAQRLMPLVVSEIASGDDDDDVVHELPDPPTTTHVEYLVYQVRDQSGSVVLRSHDAPATPLTKTITPGFQDIDGFRLYTESAINPAISVQVAEPASLRLEAIWESVASLLIPLVGIVPIAGFAVWFIVRRALRPVGVLSAEIAARDGANLDPLPATQLPTELRRIGIAVDRLLGRLRLAIGAERAFSANTAHELRTPIAGALAQTQRLILELPAGAQRNRAYQVETAVSNLGRVAEKLLQLSRADAGVFEPGPRRDLRPVLDLLVEDFRRQQGGDRIVLAADEGSRLRATMQPDAFAIIVRNLLENALRHGDPAGPVTISLPEAGTVSVTNGGAVVPPAVLTTLKQRFSRANPETEGSGLGLSIADTIAAQAGGGLELRSPATGRADGFEAILRLP